MLTQEKSIVENEIIINLDSLQFERKLALGISVCKQLYPDYEAFVKKYNHLGDSGLAKSIITLLEHYPEDRLNQSVLEAFSQLMDYYIEELEEFQTENKSKASDTVFWPLHALYAINYTISFLKTGDSELINLALNTAGEGVL